MDVRTGSWKRGAWSRIGTEKQVFTDPTTTHKSVRFYARMTPMIAQVIRMLYHELMLIRMRTSKVKVHSTVGKRFLPTLICVHSALKIIHYRIGVPRDWDQERCILPSEIVSVMLRCLDVSESVGNEWD